MTSQEPDAAAVVTLGAIFVVLTFLSGFLSERLHGAYRDAVDQQRQLGSQLVTRSSALTARLEEDYESTRRSLADALATPVLVVLAGLVVVGIWLDISTWRAAHLRWLDYRTLTLGLLALGLVAVASLAFADYWRLRRRLGAAIDKSPVHRLLLAEAAIARVWDRKVRLASANVRLEYSYIVSGVAKESLLNETDPALKEVKARSFASLEAVEQDDEREQATADRGLQQAEPELKNAQRVLAELAAQPGLEPWGGRIAGSQALAGLVEEFNPERSRCHLSPSDTPKVRAWLQAAITAEPWQPRWLRAGAAFAETQGDTAGAAACYVRAGDQGLQNMETEGVSSLLEPREETDERASMGPREPATYRAVFDLRKNANDWLGAASAAELYLMATFAQHVLDIEQSQSDPFEPVVKCIREAVDGLCRHETVLRVGWILAENFLRSCKDLAEQPRQWLVQQALRVDPDLSARLDQLNRELVTPRRAAADAERSARDDQRFKELSRRFGVSIQDGTVSVKGQNGNGPLGAAHADLAPQKAERLDRRIRGSATKTSAPGMNIAIKAGDFEATVRPDPLLPTDTPSWWVDRFNEAAQAAKKSVP